MNERPRDVPPDNLYARQPLSAVEVGDGQTVPIFSEEDRYIRNYQKIAADHIVHFEATGDNPFLPDDYWREAEASTERMIRKHAQPGTRILDVGVGMGRLMSRLPEWSRYGIDISTDYLAYAARAGVQVCMARIEDMPYQRGHFHYVVSTDVLEHVLDVNLAMERMLAVLKPGGLLFLRLPYNEDLRSYVNPKLPYEFVHVRRFDEHTMQLLCEKILGCRIVEMVKGPYYKQFVRSRLWWGTRNIAIGWLGAKFPDALKRRLFDPIEFNIVIEKPATGGNGRPVP